MRLLLLFLNAASALFAIAAAVVWLRSARVKTPERIDAMWSADGFAGGPALEALAAGLRRQSHLSAWAAVLAAVAASLQAVALGLAALPGY